MKENIVKTMALENGHTLEIHDFSRKIGADAWVVIMAARMKIDIHPALFDPLETEVDNLAHIKETLGDHIIYEYKSERNMIMDQDKDGVLENLMDTFLKNTGQYVAKPRFPGKLVLKEYKARIEKKRYR